jgi:hypothetical protein
MAVSGDAVRVSVCERRKTVRKSIGTQIWMEIDLGTLRILSGLVRRERKGVSPHRGKLDMLYDACSLSCSVLLSDAVLVCFTSVPPMYNVTVDTILSDERQWVCRYENS